MIWGKLGHTLKIKIYVLCSNFPLLCTCTNMCVSVFGQLLVCINKKEPYEKIPLQNSFKIPLWTETKLNSILKYTALRKNLLALKQSLQSFLQTRGTKTSRLNVGLCMLKKRHHLNDISQVWRKINIIVLIRAAYHGN